MPGRSSPARTRRSYGGIVLTVAVALACPASGARAVADPPTAGEIEAILGARGADAAVAALTRDGMQPGTRWGWAMVGIGTGQAEWLRVAARLRAGTGGRATASLFDALSTALRRNAPGVLALMGPRIPPEEVCRLRLPDPRPIDVRVFQVHTQDAVAAVTVPELRRVRDRCLALLSTDDEAP